MSVTAAELAQYGKSSIDLYMKNDPIDTVNADRPFLAFLMNKRRETGSGKQYKVVQIRTKNDSNAQSFYGSQQVTYNRRDTLDQAKYEYVNYHDGFSLHEDDFIRNGVTIADGPGKQATASEKTTITNLFKEQNETLRLGFEESLDALVHLNHGIDCSALVPNELSNQIVGLSDMIQITPASGTYASISRSNAYWQNFSATGVITATDGTGTIEENMRAAWRACTKYGGRPDQIFVGSTFLDKYVDYMLKVYGRVNYQPIAQKSVEMAEGGVYYQGVPLVWDPTFDTLDDNSLGSDQATYPWKKRCYMINSRYFRLEPIKNQWMVSRMPPRVYNKYEYYWALTTRFYLTNTKPQAHAVICIA